jgi:hypothetical protein
MSDDQKDSQEVREFRSLFAYIRQLCDDDAQELRGLGGDESVTQPAIDLLCVAGVLQRRQRSRPELSTNPVDPGFIKEWQFFELSYAAILVEVAQQSTSGDFILGEFYQPLDPAADESWFRADFEAISHSHAFRAALLRVETLAVENSAGTVWHPMNEMHSKSSQAQYLEDARAASLNSDRDEKLLEKLYDWLFGETRQPSPQEQVHYVRKAASMEDHLRTWEQVDPVLQTVFFKWEKASYEAGLDLRGILRRRALVPFVHFPRHVSRRLQGGDEPSVYNNLRQAHDAFIFGAPFAALALMRSVMERVLRTSYGASGADLDALIRSVAQRLPPAASAAALHRLRRSANAVLHDRETSNDAPAWSRSSVREAELDMLSLLGVLRNLIEGAPERPA